MDARDEACINQIVAMIVDLSGKVHNPDAVSRIAYISGEVDQRIWRAMSKIREQERRMAKGEGGDPGP